MLTSEWLELNTTLRKKAFTMKKHPFQRRILDDMHINLACIKPSQVGLTEIQIRKALAWVRRNDGVSLIYTMPNDEMKNRVSQTRVRPIIDEDKVFNSEFDEEAVRSKGLLQFGQSFLYLTGAKEGDATSIPADFVMNDEVDLTSEEMVSLFRSRLQGSSYKINQKFSTPTYAKTGVSADYTISDQHEYMVKCDRCNHQQSPLFTRNFCCIPGLNDDEEDLIKAIDSENWNDLDLANAYVMCEKCQAPLDLEREDREWVPLFPSRSYNARGYRIRPFSTSNLDIPYLVRELVNWKRKGKIRRFYNTVLGESYTDDSIALNEDVVKQRFGRANGWPYVDQPCYVGIDMGMICHVVVGTYNSKEGWLVFHWDQVEATRIVPYVGELMKKYNIVAGTVDRHPYTPTAIDIRTESKGRILPVEYRNPLEITVKENELSPEETFAQINRTAALDEVVKAIRSTMMTFVNYETREALITTHLTDMVRHEEEGEKAVWIKQTGDDHFFHALAYMVVAKKAQDYIIFNNMAEIRTMVAHTTVDMTKPKTDTLLPQGTKNKPRAGFKGE